jgi:hypothetical protein
LNRIAKFRYKNIQATEEPIGVVVEADDQPRGGNVQKGSRTVAMGRDGRDRLLLVEVLRLSFGAFEQL